MASYRSLRRLARVTSASLALTAVLLVLAPVTVTVQSRLIDAAIRSPTLTYKDMENFDTGPVPGLVYEALGVMTLVSFAFFAIWLYRARRNLDSLIETPPRWGWGWTLAGWLIPVANLVAPPAVLAEVVRESRRAATGRPSRVGWLVWFGWLALLCGIGYSIVLSLRPAGPSMWVAIFSYGSLSDRVSDQDRAQFATIYHINTPGPIELAIYTLFTIVAVTGVVVVWLASAAQRDAHERA
jgi:hypothetical protein